MRLVPTMPEMMRMMLNHHSGLNAKRMEKASRAPSKPPMAAVWVDTFHQTLMMAQTICMMSAATRMLAMNCGMWR